MKEKYPSAQPDFSKIHFLFLLSVLLFLMCVLLLFFGWLGFLGFFLCCCFCFFKGNRCRLCEMWLAALFTSKVITF